MIGAILTQQTRWENVERALRLLKERNLCSMAALDTADIPAIEAAVRCTGFYRMKTRRLKALAAFVMGPCGGVAGMETMPTGNAPRRAARGEGHWRGDCGQHSLLWVWPGEFCDRCLHRTHRPVCRDYHSHAPASRPFSRACLKTDSHVYRQTHAHIVEYAKSWCTKKRCEGCRIMDLNG